MDLVSFALPGWSEPRHALVKPVSCCDKAQLRRYCFSDVVVDVGGKVQCNTIQNHYHYFAEMSYRYLGQFILTPDWWSIPDNNTNTVDTFLISKQAYQLRLAQETQEEGGGENENIRTNH